MLVESEEGSFGETGGTEVVCEFEKGVSDVPDDFVREVSEVS
jgi:hypothetical protein